MKIALSVAGSSVLGLTIAVYLVPDTWTTAYAVHPTFYSILNKFGAALTLPTLPFILPFESFLPPIAAVLLGVIGGSIFWEFAFWMLFSRKRKNNLTRRCS